MHDPLTTYPSFLPETMSESFREGLAKLAGDPGAELYHLLCEPAGVHPDIALANPALLVAAVTEPEAFTNPDPLSASLSGLHAIAGHPDVPESLLRLLLTSNSGRVVAAAINNPSVTPELLEHALLNLSINTKGRRNEHVPDYMRIHDELYRRLPLDRAIELAMSRPDSVEEPIRPLLTHPDLSFTEALELYEQAFTTGKLRDELGNRARAALIKHPHATPEYLEEARTMGSTAELTALAEAPAASGEILTKLVRYFVEADEPPESRTWAKRYRERLGAPFMEALETIAARPDLPKEACRLIEAAAHTESRKRLAENPATPPDAIQKLLQATHPDVRRRAARNPNAPTHGELPQDKPELRAGRAQHPHLTLDERLSLLPDLGVEWLEFLGRDRNTHKALHERLLEHPSPKVRANALSNPQTTTAELLRDADTPYRDAQIAIALHRNTPEHIVHRFLKSENETVRRAAHRAYHHNRVNGRTPTRP